MRARQKVSRAGVELIKSFEGLRQSAARLPDGRWTIGYGHTFSAREGARVTQEDADALLRFDLLPIVDSLNNMVLVPLNQNQFDALVSFCFNIGVDNFATSTVLKRINEGRMTEAAVAMDAWRSAEFNGQTYVLAPLIRRRAAEKNLFLTPEDVAGTAPTLLVRPMADTQGDAAAHPAELDAPDRGGVLTAYPAGEPQAAPQPVAQPAPQPAAFHAAPAVTPEQPLAAPVAVPQAAPNVPLSPYAGQFAPQPVTQEPPAAAHFTPEPAPQPATPQPVAPQPVASPTAATPVLPLSPYAGQFSPQSFTPQPQPVAPQTEPARQFIDLASVAPRAIPDAPPQQPVLRPSDISPYPPAAPQPAVPAYISPYAQPAAL
ncbi:MAG: glycoside hydrolase family protein [Asticcacaulis sp.]